MGDEASIGSWAFKLLMVVCVLMLLKRIVQHLRYRFFAAFMTHMNKVHYDPLNEKKRDLFVSLSTAVSHDPKLRKQKALKILEIGVGSGTNFAFYPDGTHLVVVDPNPHFKPYYDDNRHKFTNIHSEEIILSTAEEMDMVESSSVDVVVCTFVFCSITDTKKALQQILRVLVPGGRFYFYEHIAEFDTKRHGTRRKMQELITRLGIWPFFCGGCKVNRDVLEDIQHAGFSEVKAQRSYTAFKSFLLEVVNPALVGVAEK